MSNRASDPIWARVVSTAREGDFGRAFRLLGQAAGRALKLPRDLSVFFPAEDGRQDLMYEQDFGLEDHAPEFLRAQKAVLTAPLGAFGRDLLAGYLDLFLGRYGQARRRLARAAQAAPADYWPQFLHACALWLSGDKLRTRDLLPEALEAIEKALAADSTQLYAYVIRAGLRREMEDVPGRLADARRVCKMDPKFVWAHTELAEVLSEEGHYQPALREANGLIFRFPREAWAWAQRGRIRGISGYYKLALADFEKAVVLDPKNGPLFAWRGETLRRLGRYDEALADLDRSIRLDPGYRLAYAWRGRVRLLLGGFWPAIRDFNACLRLEPREMLARAWRGEAWWKLGEARRAVQDYDAIHPAEPRGLWNARLKRHETQENYFMLDGRGGKRERAFWEDLDAGVAARPRDGWAWSLRGSCRVAAGDPRGGGADLTRALQLDGGNARSWAWRGEAVRRMGAPARALKDLDRAVELDGANRWARAWRGRALADLGRLEEAAASFARAADSPEQRYAQIHVWRGETLWRLGRRAEAAESFRRAFRLDGKCKAAREWLGRLERAGLAS